MGVDVVNPPDEDRHESAPVKRARTPRLLPARVILPSVLLLVAGLAIAWVDTRPGWDDTGVTAGALLITAAMGSLATVPPWLAAGLVAGPIVVAEARGGSGVLLEILFALAGAYSGAVVRRRIGVRER